MEIEIIVIDESMVGRNGTRSLSWEGMKKSDVGRNSMRDF